MSAITGWKEGLVVEGVEEMRGCNKDVPLAVNHSNRCGGKAANQNSSNETDACLETLHAVLFR